MRLGAEHCQVQRGEDLRVSCFCPHSASLTTYIFPQLEDDTPNLLSSYANVIIAATYLGIPARDLADGLTKRMQGIARKVLMSWDEVEWFYTSPALNNCKDSLREVAAASVFWAWWNAVLNEEDTPEDMDVLEEMRVNIPKLDDDLHDWCERNETEVRKKWEEKKTKKESCVSDDAGAFQGWDTIGIGKNAARGGDGGGGGIWDTGDTDAFKANPNSAASGAWDVDGSAGGPENSDFGFDSGISMNHSANIKKENVFHGNGHGQAQPTVDRGTGVVVKTDDWDGAGGGEWADEVNEHQALTW